MKIAVVGAGIYGTTIAWKLGSKFSVDLYEKENNILQAASGINQYRLHRGYHYPRSDETAADSKIGHDKFLEEYGDCIVKSVDNYYCISKKDSLTSNEQFINFCKKHELSFKEQSPSVVKKESISLSIKPEENIFDVQKLRNICYKKLKQNKVNIFFQELNFDNLNNYDYVIYSLYANSNAPFLNRPNLQRDYQFELCEKPVFKLPQPYKNQSIVIMDGPFMCIDPLGDTGYHVMGNVVHAIHSTNIGKFPEIPEKFKPLLNKGLIKNPPITNVDNFLDSANEFFIDIKKSEHIGSMFTIRTVLPFRDHDDARPTIVRKVSDREYSVFAGKIGTCVLAAEVILNSIDKELKEIKLINHKDIN